MEKIFICESEARAFQMLHPEYNNYIPVIDKEGELIGYEASVVDVIEG